MRCRFGPFVGVILFVLLLSATLGAAALLGGVPAFAGAPPTSAPAAPSPASADDPLALLAVQQAQLLDSDGGYGDLFGHAVAISGDTAVVGAYQDDVGGNANQGSACVFVRSGGSWTQQAELTASDSAADEQFGNSVAISGDTGVVGAWCDTVGTTTQQGSAYVFTRSGTTWTQQAKLTASDGAAYDQFGSSVAVSQDTAVVGSWSDDVGSNANQGSAYVFVRGGTAWTQQAHLTASDGAEYDCFGFAAAISGDTAVLGAPFADVGANVRQGAAYIFARSGTTWNQQLKLTAGEAGDLFGYSVAISGDTAVVGAEFHHIGTHADQGSAYVSVRSGTTWSPPLMLAAADGAADDYFGCSVAISSDTLVVGARARDVGANANQGCAYAFTRTSSGAWTQQAQLLVADGAAGDELGYSVAVSGDSGVVGAEGHAVGANSSQGAAYVFTGLMAAPDTPTPGSPRGFIRRRVPTFRWSAVAGADSYKVCVYRGGRLVAIKTGITATEWRCTTTLRRCTWLTWQVRARNAGGASPWSAARRFWLRRL